MGTNAAGYLTITGVGAWTPDTITFYTRGFVMVLSPASSAPQPRITSISGAGTASVTVNYTNSLSGTNYTLSYNTNLATTNWYAVGTKTATGTSDFQTDTPPVAGPQRYYRVYYTIP